MSKFAVRPSAAFMAVLGSLAFASTAGAATLTVDDDGADCPAAGYTSVQAAVDAASSGDTVIICDGTYVEGSGAIASNAVTITKSLKIKGVGADDVTIRPKAIDSSGGVPAGQIAENAPNIRNGVGDVISVIGGTGFPITVDISGVTVEGSYDDIDQTPPKLPSSHVYVEAGIVYLDAQGTLLRDRVTNIVTSDTDNSYTVPGGYRSNNYGYGIAQVTANSNAVPGASTRTLNIVQTRVDKYNKVGVLIDGATSDATPQTPSGVINRGVISSSQVVGRNQCSNYVVDPLTEAGNPTTGQCQTPTGGLSLPMTLNGPLFGQDGIRVTAGARLALTGSAVSSNHVNGVGGATRAYSFSGARTTGSPTVTNINPLDFNAIQPGQTLATAAGFAAGTTVVSTTPPSGPSSTGSMTLSSSSTATGNTTFAIAAGPTTNLGLGAGVRLVDAGSSLANRDNIVDNAFGAYNVLADGATPNTLVPFSAENNWWGLRLNGGTVNNGPLISPALTPPTPENPVNGAATADGVGTTSTAVDFFPFRGGSQADSINGEYPIFDSPLPVSDAAPSVALSLSDDTVTRGTGSVQVISGAADDYAVRDVTFYDGDTVLGAVQTAGYTLAFAPAADAACGSHEITAVARDTLGQTASGSIPITVTCPTVAPPTGPGAPVPPAPPAPAPPAPPAPPGVPVTKLSTGGTTVTVNPTAAAGVAKVEFYLGTRRLCTVTKAPYSCAIVPTSKDVGLQTLRIVVTDAKGQSSSSERTIRVPRFTGRLTLQKVLVTTSASGKKVRTARGALVFATKRVKRAQACANAKVTLIVKKGGTSVSNVQVPLRADCTFRSSYLLSRSKSNYVLSARFGGNHVVTPATATRRFT